MLSTLTVIRTFATFKQLTCKRNKTMKVENKVEAFKTEEMDNSSLYICFEGGHQMQQIQGANSNRTFEQQIIQMLC